MGDYHDIYRQTDVALLADVFENFRKICDRRVRPRPCTLLHIPRVIVGRLAEKHRGEARAPDGLRHAPLRREGPWRWNFDGKQEVCEGQQPERAGL